MKLLLTDTNPRMTEAWKSFFSDRMDVLIIEADLTKLKVDAVVSKEIVLGTRMHFSSFAEAQKYHWNINPQGLIFGN